ncbi:MAG: DUF89 family protein [Planctomycetes bacterium]|nr:DUF89 family protein [Planctomycetota bacterium]
MKTSPDCIPCILRQALVAARKVSENDWLHRKVLNEVMQHLQEGAFDRSPAEVLSDALVVATRMLGSADPFAPEKATWTERVQALEPGLRAEVERAPDRFAAAVRLAVAANALDAVVLDSLDPRRFLAEAFERKLGVDDLPALREAVAKAKDVLYCLDNAGELLLDRLLLEQLAPGRRVGIVVRNSPVLTDATEAEARAAGLDTLGELLPTGSDTLGVPLSLCSSELKKRFAAADLVISKGSANFETLEESDAKAFHLFVVKCSRVAAHLSLAVGDGVVLRRRGKAGSTRARRLVGVRGGNREEGPEPAPGRAALDRE